MRKRVLCFSVLVCLLLFSGCTKSAEMFAIGENAFYNTAWFDAQADGPVYLENVLYICKGESPEEVIIKEGTLGIGYHAFLGQTTLKKLELPDGLKYIGQGAFFNCDNLTGVAIPGSVYEISQSAFAWCESMTTLELGNGVTIIQSSAFSSCENLKTVVIPASVKRLNDAVFLYCHSMEEVRFLGSAPVFHSRSFNGTTTTVKYPANDPSWTSSIMLNYGGRLTWESYERLGVLLSSGAYYEDFAQALANCDGDNEYMILFANQTVEAELNKDLYIDLAGYDLSGTIKTNGFDIYGMDSTTDSYTCQNIGYFTCTEEDGSKIMPIKHFKSDITGSVKRYMTVESGEGYSFHRFFLGITHMSVKPTTMGVGYKAALYGDEMVLAELDSNEAFGYYMNLEGHDGFSVWKDRESLVSGQSVTLRVDHFDVENYGEVPLNASAAIKLSDGTVIESATSSMTLRGLMEQLNKSYWALSEQQLNAVKAMI